MAKKGSVSKTNDEELCGFVGTELGADDELTETDRVNQALAIAREHAACSTWLECPTPPSLKAPCAQQELIFNGTPGEARAKVMYDNRDINLEDLYRYHEKHKTKIWDGCIARYIGEILLNFDDQHMSEAKHWIEKAIDSDKKNDMKLYLGKDYALYAELLKRKGNPQGAKDNLKKAIEIITECGAHGWVDKYEKELAEL